jgi:hypothetical protein
MMLSAEALEIITYLKTAPNKFVSMVEISRRAGGRRLFEDSQNWARNLMPRLLEAGLIEVNARGHYRYKVSAQPESNLQAAATPAPGARRKRAKIVGEDYFPASQNPVIIGGDYFPPCD